MNRKSPKRLCLQSEVTDIDNPNDEIDQFRDLVYSQNDLRLSKQFCDIVINVKGKEFPAHRLVLAACSPYFKGMFTSGLKESKESKLNLDYLDQNTFESILNYAYTARIDINDDNVQSLLAASSFLQMDKIQVKCSQYLEQQLNPSNCLGIGLIADMHNYLDLKNSAMDYCLKHFEEVAKSEEFLNLTVDRLIEIIKDDELNVSSEIKVYDAVVRWKDSSYKRVTITRSYFDLFQHVRFSHMSRKYLVELSRRYWIRQNEKIRTCVEDAKDYLLSGCVKTRSFLCIEPRHFYGHLKLFAFGGIFEKVEKYDPQLDTWEDVDELVLNQMKGSFSILQSGNFHYSLSNRRLERYDLLHRRSLGFSDFTRKAGASLAISGDLLYVIGGHNDARVCAYNFTKKVYYHREPLKTARAEAAAVVLNGSIYVMGGLNNKDSDEPLNTVERYDIRSGEWSTVAPMIEPRHNLACVTYKGYIYAVGGKNGSCPIKSCERYDPSKITNVWQSIPSMKQSRSSPSLAVMSRFIYAAGNCDGTTCADRVEVYDTLKERWSDCAPLRRIKASVALLVIDGSKHRCEQDM